MGMGSEFSVEGVSVPDDAGGAEDEGGGDGAGGEGDEEGEEDKEGEVAEARMSAITAPCIAE